MLPAKFFIRQSRNFVQFRSICSTPIRRMPFAKHEVVPDVIPVAPKNIAKVDYKSGGENCDEKKQI
jgi:hypothetical protein